jgi:hypothetical protein
MTNPAMKIVKWALIGALGLVPLGASAKQYEFNFSTADSVFTVNGIITTADTVDALGGYDVLSISGTVSGPDRGAISLVADPSEPNPYDNGAWIYDNVYLPGAAPWWTIQEFSSPPAAMITIYIRRGLRRIICRRTIPLAIEPLAKFIERGEF